MDYAKLLEKRDDTRPLYVQLKEALTGAIGSGDLPTGTRLEVFTAPVAGAPSCGFF